MSEPSDNWPLVAKLCPQLRKHVQTHPQVYRGERWYVLRDESNGRHLRFSAAAYEFIARLDGENNVDDIQAMVATVLGEGALTRDDAIVILTQLFAIDILRSGLPSDAKEFFKRFQHERRIRRQRAIMNPLAMRFPLLDPDTLLNRFLPWVRPLFSYTGVFVWCLVVGLAGLLALVNFPALSAVSTQNILAPANLISMLIMFTLIKLAHEFSHAFAVKMWGGEVHDMGISLLVLVPVPYVDASAAWGFRDKRKRVLVGAVGILAELFLASLAFFVWLAVEPGLVKDAAFNAMLIGSISTLLFNANPLLRFDGYYVLQDLIEIPNLYSRANRYYLYLIQRYLFGLKNVHSPVTAAGEPIWFAIYGLTALFYRLFIMLVIVLFLAEEYLFIGVALGIWSITLQVVLPFMRGMHFLASSAQLTGRRLRAGTVSSLSIVVSSAFLFLLPVSLTSHAEGIVWVADQAQIYAAADGFVGELLVEPGDSVTAGTPVIQMYAPLLEKRIAVMNARQRELELRITAERLEQRLASEITREELRAVEAELALYEEQKSALLIHSQVAGTFVLAKEQHLTGRYLEQGQLIAYVISPERMIIRAVVPQSEIGLVRQRIKNVEARFAEQMTESRKVQVLMETPAASTILPSRALGSAGGGDIAVRMNDSGGTTAAEKVFQLDLSIAEDVSLAGVGERVYVRFDHGSEPLAVQWLRNGRQLLLSRLSF